MLRTFLLAGASLLFIPALLLNAQEPDPLTPTDHKVMEQLKGTKEAGNLVFHYRPADFDSFEALSEVEKTNVESFEACGRLLGMEYDGDVHIFLYRDVEDLQKTAGVQAVAFSTGTVSVHQAKDFNSVHELVHIFALQFPRDEDAVTDEFAMEGLATILAKVDEDIPIHSWAAVYQDAFRLPDLIELRKAWTGGNGNGVHNYHVAGSFVGYLIDQFGIEKVKQWYVNSTEAHMAFGKTFPRLEKEWRQWLNTKVKVKDEHRAHVLAKLGLQKMPDSYAKAKATELFDGMTMGGLNPEVASSWSAEHGILTGTNKGQWSPLYIEQEFPANVGVRMRFRLVEGDAVKIEMNRTKDSRNELIFAAWATYLSHKAGGHRPVGNLKINRGEWTEAVIVSDQGTARLYVNGVLMQESKDCFHSNNGQIGIGVEKGTLEVQELITFEL